MLASMQCYTDIDIQYVNYEFYTLSVWRLEDCANAIRIDGKIYFPITMKTFKSSFAPRFI